MLFCVVIVFFLCNILAFIVNVLEMFGIEDFYLTMTNNFLVTVNSSVNFIIYCIFGQKFRSLFLQIFCFGALSRIPNGPMLESGIGGNSVYREGRSLTNGRSSTHTRSTRLSSWGGTQIYRVNNGEGWTGNRSFMSMKSNPQHGQYKNVPLQEFSGRNGGGNLTKNDTSVISPSIDPLLEKDEKSDIV